MAVTLVKAGPERLEPGSYPGRMTQIIDLGTQLSEYQGNQREYRELLTVWEMSKCKSDGTPFVLSQRCKNSMNPKSRLYSVISAIMRKTLTTADINQLVLGNLLDACCLLTVTLEESSSSAHSYNRIVSVSPLPEGLECAPRVNDLVEFGLEDINDVDLANKLFPWVKETISKAKELKTVALPF